MCDFYADLEYSRGEQERTDIELLKQAIPDCVNVSKTDEATDRKGIDYIATLKNGAEINIDGKTRKKGVKFVGNYPELALEIWSVMPKGTNKGKEGWTCSTKSNVDMILYTFDKSDYDKFFLVPFQFLRMAFQQNCRKWLEEGKGRMSIQHNDGWDSQCMFVPSNIVLKSVAAQMMKGVNNG